MCNTNAVGLKCDACPIDNYILTRNGCIRKDEYTPTIVTSCDQLRCHHGAKCIINKSDNRPECQCPVCTMQLNGYSSLINLTMCGSDGQTYVDMCHLLTNACKYQIDLVAVSIGSCAGNN